MDEENKLDFLQFIPASTDSVEARIGGHPSCLQGAEKLLGIQILGGQK